MTRSYDEDHDEDGRPVHFDDENPEWTEEMFARARPGREVLPPEVLAAWSRGRGPQRRPIKKQVTLRLDEHIVDAFKSSGPGWQTRINQTLDEALRKRA